MSEAPRARPLPASAYPWAIVPIGGGIIFTMAHLDETTATAVQSRFDAKATPPKLMLVVTDGPDRGRTLAIDGSQPGRVLVGQAETCALRLTDPEVSRRHFALDPTPDGVRITDLGSTNGTFVDRVRVIEGLLSGGEILLVGTTAIRVDTVDGKLPSPPDAAGFGRVVGSSPEMRCLYPLFERFAASAIPLVIEGETGTGKEVLAESVHEMGVRKGGPFVVFDCTAVPPSLVESELFGHVRGAFTGAVAARKGVFEQADGGTLLIDEIGELEPALQPKLLRVLERSEIRRVGGDKWIKVDVRVIAATRRDLDREVQAGRFREDLFHRLAVGRVELPALRHRRGDIAILARHLWRTMGGDEQALSPAVIGRWLEDPWPGNVRELRNAVARQLALGDLAFAKATRAEVDRALEPGDGDTIERLLETRLPFTVARDRLCEEFERRFVERLLAEHGGDAARAAAASGIGLRYFQKLRARSK